MLLPTTPFSGLKLKNFYTGEIPLACDMSSDIFSRKINIEDFDLIYAGAQKNMGPCRNYSLYM